jgi:hypothetical protein
MNGGATKLISGVHNGIANEGSAHVLASSREVKVSPEIGTFGEVVLPAFAYAEAVDHVPIG